MARLFYRRHWILLFCCAAVLNVAARRRLLTDLSATFALYGALHASALALALRAKIPMWRRVLLVVIAAGLSVMTLRLGLIGMQITGTLPGNVGLYVTLGFSAMVAATTYGILIRLLAIPELTARSIAFISFACMLAAYAAFFVLANIHWLGRWLLAVFWWAAMSGGLWFCDPERNAAARDAPAPAADRAAT